MNAIQMSPIGRMERILLATDGTEYSTSAEILAIDLAERAGAELHIVRAIVEGAWGMFTPGGATPLQEEAEAHLAALKAKAEALGIPTFTALPMADDPSKAIIKEAKRVQADMIVIGRHERDPITRMLLGGNVIGYAPCPVLVAPPGSHFWKDILIATDGSRSSDAATVTAAALAKCCNSHVTVLSVKVPTHSQRRQAEAEKIVERGVAYLRQEGVDTKGLVREGLFDDVIIEEEHEGDTLIILGSHGRTGVGRSLFGSRTERIINRSNGPVLVVQAGG